MTTQINQNFVVVITAVSVFAIVNVISVIHVTVSANFVGDHTLCLCASTCLMTLMMTLMLPSQVAATQTQTKKV